MISGTISGFRAGKMTECCRVLGGGGMESKRLLVCSTHLFVKVLRLLFVLKLCLFFGVESTDLIRKWFLSGSVRSEEGVYGVRRVGGFGVFLSWIDWGLRGRHTPQVTGV